MANSPYTTKTISNYNNSPPADDGTTVSSNQLSWDKHKTKLGDPIKTLSEAINTELVAAFAKVINTDADENNSMAGSLAFTKNEKTISTGSITPTRSFHSVDTESNAASDTLDTIATGSVSDGCRMLLLGENIARVVTIAHTAATSTATTNITLIGQANKTLSDIHPVELVLNGGKWYENASEVDLATVAPSDLAATATSGTGLLAARSDHIHKFPTLANLGLATSDTLEINTLELGAATDTTLTRVSAGVVAVEGDSLAMVGSNQTFTKAQRGSITAITSTASSVAVDMALNNHFSHTLDVNSTLANPSNVVAGQSGSMFFTQAATGGFTLALATNYVTTGAGGVTLSTASGSVDRVDYIAETTTRVHLVTSLAVA